MKVARGRKKNVVKCLCRIFSTVNVGRLSCHLEPFDKAQDDLNAIAHRLNTRPRKCLDWATPLEVFTQLRHQSFVELGT